MSVQSLYRRPLPSDLVPFASSVGRVLFDEARSSGGLEAFFRLIEQFHTQADPAFCGLGTLVVVLNALGVDPGRPWKGPWRWYSEELLDCCIPLPRVQARGITLDELACLARCNGARAELDRPDTASEADFRAAVKAAAGSTVDPALIVAYDRRVLGQTGEGHYSPIGGYHHGSDRVLILDVARFKYPPHWVPLSALYAATRAIDSATGRSRGWVLLRRSERPVSLLFTVRCVGEGGFEGLALALAGLKAGLGRTSMSDLSAVMSALFGVGERFPVLIERRALTEPEHVAEAEELLAALRRTELHALITSLVRPPWEPDAATLLVLALPSEVWTPMPATLRATLQEMTTLTKLPQVVQVELEHLHRQLADLGALDPGGSCARCGGA